MLQSQEKKQMFDISPKLVGEQDEIFTSAVQRSLEGQNRMDHYWWKLQRLWRNQWRADWMSGIMFQGFATLQLCGKVADLLIRLGEKKIFIRRMSIFNGISGGFKDNENQMFDSFLSMREKKLFSMEEDSPQGIYGWQDVAEMYEDFETFHDRLGRLDVDMGQLIVFYAIESEVSSESDDPAHQNFLLRQYKERIWELFTTKKMSKFCIDTWFLSVVENGQYFKTKETGDLTQFNTAACRELHPSERRFNVTTKRMDPREHQNWARIWSYNQFPAR